MLLTVVFLLAIVVAFSSAATDDKDRSYFEARFADWLASFNMVPPSSAHYVQWLENFIKNDARIAAHNAQKHPYTLGHNHFSHMSYAEWRVAMRFGLSAPSTRPDNTARAVHTAPLDGEASLPKFIDWVRNGAVTPVKNQGNCGENTNSPLIRV